MSKKENYGHMTAGSGSDEERKISIIGKIEIHLNDREVKLLELNNDEGYIISVEPHEDAEKLSKQDMWISEISLHAILSTLMGLMAVKDMSPDDSLDIIKKAGMKNVQITSNYKMPVKK